MLIDSIIIYAVNRTTQHCANCCPARTRGVRRKLRRSAGYHRMTEQERQHFEKFFAAAQSCRCRRMFWSRRSHSANFAR